MGIEAATGIIANSGIVRRIVISATQTKRSRYDRWTNVEGIFDIPDPEKVKNKHILLVDDVITTGSTIESCANELLRIEGVKVTVLALAFAPI
jgi:predicted amidophosphoribosyltransferase